MPKTEKPGYQFGTFKGVFTPSILTILGVIMYLRFGWVIGNVGLISTLITVTISTSITLLTALSVSALATNMRVEVRITLIHIMVRCRTAFTIYYSV